MRYTEKPGTLLKKDFYNIELYDFLVTGDIVDQLEYTSEGLHDANHNLDKFYVALKIAEMINKG